jgi:hypothetical protein
MLTTVKPYMSPSSLITLYYSLFHSALSYGIIFWGHSSNSQKLFILRKRAIGIITGQGNRTSCTPFFKQLKILPLKSQYIYSILLFVMKHKNYITSDFTRHNIQTRQSDDFYLPSSSVTVFQNGVYDTGVKVFNNLRLELKWLIESPMKFKVAIRTYLVLHCFYTLDEFFNLNWIYNFVNINVYTINVSSTNINSLVNVECFYNCIILIIIYYCIYIINWCQKQRHQ